VFNWESDFFAMSKSGYFIECEIKVSRSDFFVDFKKEKHRLFTDVIAGKTHHIYRLQAFMSDGDLLRANDWMPAMCLHGRPVNTTEPLIQPTYHNRIFRSHSRTQATANTFKERQYIVNDWMQPGVKLDRQWRNSFHAPTSRILIKKLADINLPNQFYYVVPDGLIKLQELPKYAGLIVIREHKEAQHTCHSVHMLKRAPYMHKRSMDLDRILLKKYYNLWQYKVPDETKNAIRKNYSE
jgi:hypothetical protein